MRAPVAGTLFMLTLTLGTACRKERTPDKEPPAPVTKIPSRVTPWALGNQLSLTVLSYARGVKEDLTRRLLTECRAMARESGTKIPPLYARSGDKTRDSALAITYLLQRALPLMRGHIQKGQGAAQGALFELALRGNLLHFLYVGGAGDKVGTTMGAMMRRLGSEAGLPGAMLDTLITLLEKGAPRKEVLDALDAAYKQVGAHLSR